MPKIWFTFIQSLVFKNSTVVQFTQIFVLFTDSNCKSVQTDFCFVLYSAFTSCTEIIFFFWNITYYIILHEITCLWSLSCPLANPLFHLLQSLVFHSSDNPQWIHLSRYSSLDQETSASYKSKIKSIFFHILVHEVSSGENKSAKKITESGKQTDKFPHTRICRVGFEPRWLKELWI